MLSFLVSECSDPLKGEELIIETHISIRIGVSENLDYHTLYSSMKSIDLAEGYNASDGKWIWSVISCLECTSVVYLYYRFHHWCVWEWQNKDPWEICCQAWSVIVAGQCALLMPSNNEKYFHMNSLHFSAHTNISRLHRVSKNHQ